MVNTDEREPGDCSRPSEVVLVGSHLKACWLTIGNAVVLAPASLGDVQGVFRLRSDVVEVGGGRFQGV